MFGKVLIANRGEIAVRIIRACKKLGIQTVAVYSDADSNGLPVQLADEAHYIGPSPPKESYLCIERIIAAAVKSGAQALHPGYGFLSEDPELARSCENVGITFVGPSPEVLKICGDKVKTRQRAKEAGLPILPGTRGCVAIGNVKEQAKALGFPKWPLMVKAIQGGGGSGIGIVLTMKELEDITKRLQRVAWSVSGNSDVYLERYLKGASHIEVQILADTHGHVIHVFERDCSIQRKRQKLIEEAPSPEGKLSCLQRQQLLDWAVQFAGTIGYTNAGTMEFLVSQEGEPYLLEVNPRIQVEHGVTELVTGVDIVEWQLRIAAGEELTMKQEDIHVNGHAIEARVYAETPDFLCVPGTVTWFPEWLPAGSRIDSDLCSGFQVRPEYSPLLAKLLVRGEDRQEAIVCLAALIKQFRILGTRELDGGPLSTNRAALSYILGHPTFQQGYHHTETLGGDINFESEEAIMRMGEFAEEDFFRALLCAPGPLG